MVSFAEVMALERLDDQTFRSCGPVYMTGGPERPNSAYGGHVYAQAALAAGRTVALGMVVHSITGFFILPAGLNPFTYCVRTVRDGGNFSVRSVEASQASGPCFTCTCSFKRREKVAPPASYQATFNANREFDASLGGRQPAEHRAKRIFQAPGRKRIDRSTTPTFPGLDVTVPDLSAFNARRAPHEKRTLHYYRAAGLLPPRREDPNLHAAVHLYASDFVSMFVTVQHLGLDDNYSALASLSHTVVLHVDAEEMAVQAEDDDELGGEAVRRWFCQEIWTDRAADRRGTHHSRIWDERGRHVATTLQDGLLRLHFEGEEDIEKIRSLWHAAGEELSVARENGRGGKL